MTDAGKQELVSDVPLAKLKSSVDPDLSVNISFSVGDNPPFSLSILCPLSFL